MRFLYICDAAKVDQAAPVCRRGGFGIELHTFYRPERCRDQRLVARHREVVGGISEVANHGPFWGLDAGSQDAGARDTAREMFDLGCATAKQVGATAVVFHLGYVPGSNPYSEWLARFALTWSAFRMGKREDVQIFLENTLEDEPHSLLDALTTIDDGSTFACLDIGHAHCESKIPVTEWIEILADHIRYVHFHDNDGTADQHLAVGKGTIPMHDVCQALEKCAPDAIWAIECDWDPSLAWFRSNGYL